MRRRSKSEVDSLKQRRTQRKTDATAARTAVADESTTSTEQRPDVPFGPVVTSLKDSVVDYYAKVPHLQAFAELRTHEPSEANLLSPDAAALFEDVRQSNPNDPLALHHLAIIHHGRGFQMHLEGDRSPAAARHWHNGLQAWAKLVGNDHFWETLSSTWQTRWDDGETDMLAERLLRVDLSHVRKQIPRHLLSLHTGIVLESFSDEPNVAKQHMTIVLESQFDSAEVEAARNRVYSRILGDRDELCKSLRFDDATKKVEDYLAIDPDNPVALCDALIVSAAWSRREGGAGSNAQPRINRLRRELPRAEKLKSYAKEEWSAADAIRNFYLEWADAEHDRGQAYQSSNVSERWTAYREAMRLAKQAIQFERCGDAARKKICHICWNGAIACLNASGDLSHIQYLAREAMSAGESDAGVRTINALQYFKSENEKSFRSELQIAKQLNAQEGNSSVAGVLSMLQEAADRDPGERRGEELLVKAIKAINDSDTRAAQRHLDEMERLGSSLTNEQECSMHLFRTVCHLANESFPAAQESYRRAKRIRNITDPTLKKMLKDLAMLG